MKAIIITLLLIFCTITFQAQKQTYYVAIEINKDTKIIFLTQDKKSKLYYSPRIIEKGKIYAIEGFDENQASNKTTLDRVSKSGKYVILDNITYGYVYNGENDSTLYENYHCVVIDIPNRKVVGGFQSDCDGVWDNTKDCFIKNGECIFEPGY